LARRLTFEVNCGRFLTGGSIAHPTLEVPVGFKRDLLVWYA
jgi:hypothetical protein